MKNEIKFGDKLYVITRSDISPGYQAVQSMHALRQFTADHPEIDAQWYSESNHLALLSVNDEVNLMKLITKADSQNIRWSAFREPDIGGQITAIALEPCVETMKLCKNLPLALKDI